MSFHLTARIRYGLLSKTYLVVKIVNVMSDERSTHIFSSYIVDRVVVELLKLYGLKIHKNLFLGLGLKENTLRIEVITFSSDLQ